MDIHQLGKDLQYIGTLLATIRNLSKGNDIDFHQAPYDNDQYLLEYLLDKEIIKRIDKRNQLSKQKGADD